MTHKSTWNKTFNWTIILLEYLFRKYYISSK